MYADRKSGTFTNNNRSTFRPGIGGFHSTTTASNTRNPLPFPNTYPPPLSRPTASSAAYSQQSAAAASICDAFPIPGVGTVTSHPLSACEGRRLGALAAVAAVIPGTHLLVLKEEEGFAPFLEGAEKEKGMVVSSGNVVLGAPGGAMGGAGPFADARAGDASSSMANASPPPPPSLMATAADRIARQKRDAFRLKSLLRQERRWVAERERQEAEEARRRRHHQSNATTSGNNNRGEAEGGSQRRHQRGGAGGGNTNSGGTSLERRDVDAFNNSLLFMASSQQQQQQRARSSGAVAGKSCNSSASGKRSITTPPPPPSRGYFAPSSLSPSPPSPPPPPSLLGTQGSNSYYTPASGVGGVGESVVMNQQLLQQHDDRLAEISALLAAQRAREVVAWGFFLKLVGLCPLPSVVPPVAATSAAFNANNNNNDDYNKGGGERGGLDGSANHDAFAAGGGGMMGGGGSTLERVASASLGSTMRGGYSPPTNAGGNHNHTTTNANTQNMMGAPPNRQQHHRRLTSSSSVLSFDGAAAGGGGGGGGGFDGVPSSCSYDRSLLRQPVAYFGQRSSSNRGGGGQPTTIKYLHFLMTPTTTASTMRKVLLLAQWAAGGSVVELSSSRHRPHNRGGRGHDGRRRRGAAGGDDSYPYRSSSSPSSSSYRYPSLNYPTTTAAAGWGNVLGSYVPTAAVHSGAFGGGGVIDADDGRGDSSLQEDEDASDEDDDTDADDDGDDDHCTYRDYAPREFEAVGGLSSTASPPSASAFSSSPHASAFVPFSHTMLSPSHCTNATMHALHTNSMHPLLLQSAAGAAALTRDEDEEGRGGEADEDAEGRAAVMRNKVNEAIDDGGGVCFVVIQQLEMASAEVVSVLNDAMRYATITASRRDALDAVHYGGDGRDAGGDSYFKPNNNSNGDGRAAHHLDHHRHHSTSVNSSNNGVGPARHAPTMGWWGGGANPNTSSSNWRGNHDRANSNNHLSSGSSAALPPFAPNPFAHLPTTATSLSYLSSPFANLSAFGADDDDDAGGGGAGLAPFPIPCVRIMGVTESDVLFENRAHHFESSGHSAPLKDEAGAGEEEETSHPPAAAEDASAAIIPRSLRESFGLSTGISAKALWAHEGGGGVGVGGAGNAIGGVADGGQMEAIAKLAAGVAESSGNTITTNPPPHQPNIVAALSALEDMFRRAARMAHSSNPSMMGGPIASSCIVPADNLIRLLKRRKPRTSEGKSSFPNLSPPPPPFTLLEDDSFVYCSPSATYFLRQLIVSLQMGSIPFSQQLQTVMRRNYFMRSVAKCLAALFNPYRLLAASRREGHAAVRRGYFPGGIEGVRGGSKGWGEALKNGTDGNDSLEMSSSSTDDDASVPFLPTLNPEPAVPTPLVRAVVTITDVLAAVPHMLSHLLPLNRLELHTLSIPQLVRREVGEGGGAGPLLLQTLRGAEDELMAAAASVAVGNNSRHATLGLTRQEWVLYGVGGGEGGGVTMGSGGVDGGELQSMSVQQPQLAAAAPLGVQSSFSPPLPSQFTSLLTSSSLSLPPLSSSPSSPPSSLFAVRCPEPDYFALSDGPEAIVAALCLGLGGTFNGTSADALSRGPQVLPSTLRGGVGVSGYFSNGGGNASPMAAAVGEPLGGEGVAAAAERATTTTLAALERCLSADDDGMATASGAALVSHCDASSSLSVLRNPAVALYSYLMERRRAREVMGVGAGSGGGLSNALTTAEGASPSSTAATAASSACSSLLLDVSLLCASEVWDVTSTLFDHRRAVGGAEGRGREGGNDGPPPLPPFLTPLPSSPPNTNGTATTSGSTVPNAFTAAATTVFSSTATAPLSTTTVGGLTLREKEVLQAATALQARVVAMSRLQYLSYGEVLCLVTRCVYEGADAVEGAGGIE